MKQWYGMVGRYRNSQAEPLELAEQFEWRTRPHAAVPRQRVRLDPGEETHYIDFHCSIQVAKP